MEKFLETTGKTIDAAIQIALDELSMDRDQVSVEVLEKPRSGFLGLGSALARVKISYSVSRVDKVEAFLNGLLLRMGSEARPVIREQPDGNLSVEFVGNGLGMLIGHRGDTLDAIQHLTNFAVNRDEEKSFRVDVDAENYRAKRVDALKRLARRTGEKVLKTRKNLTLESMNAYERHIVHTTIQDIPGLTTHSVGTEPNRRVVVACERAFGDRPYGSTNRTGTYSAQDKPFRSRSSGPMGEQKPSGGYRPSGGPRYAKDSPPRNTARPKPSLPRTEQKTPEPTDRKGGAAAAPGPRNPRPYDRLPRE